MPWYGRHGVVLVEVRTEIAAPLIGNILPNGQQYPQQVGFGLSDAWPLLQRKYAINYIRTSLVQSLWEWEVCQIGRLFG